MKEGVDNQESDEEMPTVKLVEQEECMKWFATYSRWAE